MRSCFVNGTNSWLVPLKEATDSIATSPLSDDGVDITTMIFAFNPAIED